jgi:acyl-CoA thioester hydrolase
VTSSGVGPARFVSKRGVLAQRVRYADTDKAAVVHHAAYLSFLEAGRIEFFRENGFDYAKFERETGTGMPVVECTLRYRSPARFDELLEVVTEISEASRFTMWVRGVVLREGAVLVESRVRLACVSMSTETPLRMPMALYEACLEPGFDL